tara:strand:+ start:282 stop:1760 length:1479 start_codon:yes stop_codon:yes gene_type:complete
MNTRSGKKRNYDNTKKIKYDDECSDSSDSDYEELFENLKKIDRIAYKNLQKVKKEIKNKEPKVLEILKAQIYLEDKVKLFEKYENYKMLDCNTDAYIETRDNINREYQIALYKFENTKNNNIKKVDNKFDISLISDLDTIKYKILNLNCSDNIKTTIYKKYIQLKNLKTNDEEYSKLLNWVEWSIKLPHDNIKQFDNKNIQETIKNISIALNKELYGLDKVKEQLLVFITNKLLNPDIKRCNLGLVGPPGVGKTAIVKLLSKILHFPFEQISFGGVKSTEFLKGHQYTYVGSEPGEIVKCLTRMKYKNGIIFLDEYEKISDNKDIQSLLLHITDPCQNYEFRDSYLSDIPLDLSKVWFIYSMNELPNNKALQDRIFYIDVNGYSINEKIKILQKHLIPKAISNCNLKKNSIKINKENSIYLINKVNNCNKGVRNLENSINDIIMKINFIIINDNFIETSINMKLKFPVDINKIIIDKLVNENNKEKISFIYS